MRDGDRSYHLREHWPRERVRRIRLGKSVDTTAITADVDRGVLTVRLPKHRSSRPRRIDIR